MSDYTVSLVFKAINRTGGPVRAVARGVATLTREMHGLENINQRIEANAARRDSLRGQLVDAAALAYGLYKPVKAAIDFESAMADVRKVVDFAAPDGLRQMAATIKEMSRDIPITQAELAEIVAAGGQLGVKEGDLAGFARTAATMAVAFDMTASEAGDSAAKLSNVLGIPIAEIGRLGDAINHLSDNTAAKAPEIVRALLRVGGIGRQFGLSATQTAALTDAMIALGKPPEVAGTAINAMLSKLQTASTQGRDFQRVLRMMGLSAKDLETSIARDAQGALTDFLERIADLDAGKRSKALKLLFGLEYTDDLALLVGSLEKYMDALDLVGDEQRYAGSMTREFRNRADTTSNQLGLLRNAVNELGINLGSILLPGLTGAAKWIASLASGAADMAEEFPVLTKVSMWAVTGLIGLQIAAVGMNYAWALLVGGALKAWKAIRIVAIGLRLLGVAMAANPIGAAVMVVIGAITLLVTRWDQVVAYFTGGAERIGRAFDQGLLEGLWELWKSLMTLPLDIIDGLAHALFGVDLKAIGARWADSPLEGLSSLAAGISDILPGWATDLLGIAPTNPELPPPRTAVPAGSAAPGSAAAPNGHVQVDVSIKSDAQTRVDDIRSDSPDVGVGVDTGMSMVAP